MTICRKILCLCILASCYLYTHGEQYKCVNGNITCEVSETNSQYVVIASYVKNIIDTRNYNILERRLRLQAIDVIGSYILFKSHVTYSNLSSDYFQAYVDGLGLHYNAIVSNAKQNVTLEQGKMALRFVCNKNDYNIDCATYKQNVNITTSIIQRYSASKNEINSKLLWNYYGMPINYIIELGQDFLSGVSKMPKSIRILQSIGDRFEYSIYGLDNSNLNQILSSVVEQMPKSCPYRSFAYVELVTAASLKNKQKYYSEWSRTLQSENLWCKLLKFCYEVNTTNEVRADMTTSDVIMAYSGAISPFGIRHAVYEPNFAAATQAYANGDFEKSVNILSESIDVNGISTQTLNLIGASYRLKGLYSQALAYLILCFRENHNTTYLIGNIALCLYYLGFPKMKDFNEQFAIYAQDDWSKEQLQYIINHYNLK